MLAPKRPRQTVAMLPVVVVRTPARPRRTELPLPSIVRMSLEMLGKGVDTAEQF